MPIAKKRKTESDKALKIGRLIKNLRTQRDAKIKLYDDILKKWVRAFPGSYERMRDGIIFDEKFIKAKKEAKKEVEEKENIAMYFHNLMKRAIALIKREKSRNGSL